MLTKRGASMACCGSIPNSTTFRKSCAIACTCASPPGVPNGMNSRPSLSASAGFGVSRGRFHGAIDDGCSGSSQLCDPRVDIAIPISGTSGTPTSPSLGVAEKALPAPSTTQV